MILSRRGLFTGVAALLAAPAIVRATSLMPVKPWHGYVDVLMDTQPAFRSYLGWDQLKQEGEAVSFDPGVELKRFPAGETIYVGDLVATHSDGRMYRLQGTCDSDINVMRLGIAARVG